jgi:Ran GTPase-activating protein (RanGAP) involved in mRNA processing and transport
MNKGLKMNCSLIHLDIGSNDITDEGAIKLFKMLGGHPTLTSLVVANHDRLHRNRMGDKACQALGELLARNQILTMLNIADNSISNEGIRLISQGFELAPSKELVSLNLSHNDLEGVQAIEALGAFLESTSSLVQLNLSENRIGDAGIELLSKAFNEGKSRLSKLYLGSVGGTAAGFKTLFLALKSNQHLTFLNLDGNDFKCPPRITREQLLKA